MISAISAHVIIIVIQIQYTSKIVNHFIVRLIVNLKFRHIISVNKLTNPILFAVVCLYINK
jgi:hypothetical protein